jgi:phage tail sheath gpL-like
MSLGDEIVTRILGYALLAGNFQLVSPNLPVRIGILAEANDAAQAGLVIDRPTQITNVAQAAAIGGWGSPIYQIAKILFPRSGSSLGGIPVFVYPQLKAGGAAAKVTTLTITGPATASGTHYIVIAGRKAIDGATLAVNIVKADTATAIAAKYAAAIQAALGCTVSATSALGVVTMTAKWSGLTSQDITASVDSGTDLLGLTYVFNVTTPGTGTPAVDASLQLFANDWITHVINGYGLVSTVMDSLEAYNGKPVIGSNPASGRYLGTNFKPFVAYSGSVSADPSATTDTRLNDLTIKVSPAPNSPGLPMEAAANDCLLAAVCAQNSPQLDTCGQSYPDMPVPSDGNIGVMKDWSERDRIVKKGCSTVNLVGGVYQIQDPVTTYHPVGEVPPAYRYVRTLIIDWNVFYTYRLNEERYVVGRYIANDNDSVSAPNYVKPKNWRARMATIAEQLVSRGLLVDAPFMNANTTVQISATNSDRFQTAFQYKRSGYTRQADTSATAGFNYGTLTVN